MNESYIFLVFAIVFVVIIITTLIISYFKNPFHYPFIKIDIDISGKRQPNYEEFIDEYIINLHKYGSDVKRVYEHKINKWEIDAEAYLRSCFLWKQRRREIYEMMCRNISRTDYEVFDFEFDRNQTRYRQQNYQKQSYIVKNVDNVVNKTLNEMIAIEVKLSTVDFETTRSKWNSKNQRKLMTKSLRDKIKRRDHYTCQKCGKYMPDEVGLHIDHIVPIKKGGRTVESNLQVLCDKCNLKKGSD